MHDTTTPWHRESYERLLREGLPALLAERVALAGYRLSIDEGDSCRVELRLALGPGEIALDYSLPWPDERGVFSIDGRQYVVVALADSHNLEQATIRCVGEQLHAYLAGRLQPAPAHLPWDEALARAWLPLDTWAVGFLSTPGWPSIGVYPLEATNWLATNTQLRRLVVADPRPLTTDGQIGRACPVETPEGPNVGRILVIARGATVRDGRLVVVDDRPAAALGLGAGCIPFLEHDELPRLLMGANMLRQWLPQPDPEPALVQTGLEPDAPDFWCGRNLLTASIAWDADTFEDGIVVSESAARRLGAPAPLEVGDKLSNRHGTKGVVARILPDAAMPQLPDGRPVELIYSVMGLPSRLNLGQLREALLGRIAQLEGRPALCPPFAAPDEAALRGRAAAAGLAPDGREQLTLGVGGPPLEQLALAGYVYWGKLVHTARSKLRAWTGAQPPEDLELHGHQEYVLLRQLGATNLALELIHTRNAARPGVAALSDQLRAGWVEQAPPPSPHFQRLARLLGAAGIDARLDGERVRLRFATPEGALPLAAPLPHPWLRERSLAAVGALPELPAWAALVEANERLQRLLASEAPEVLRGPALDTLQRRLDAYLEALFAHEPFSLRVEATFGARAVAAPGAALQHDQVGVPEPIARALFGPRVAGDADAGALDAAMADAWVVVSTRVLSAESMVAFRPVRIAEPVVRLPLVACALLDADFDGDQVALFLPVTAAGQREAAELLSVGAHLARNPALAEAVRPRMDALFALARHSLTAEGRAELEGLAGGPVPMPDGILTRAGLGTAIASALAREGPGAALAMVEALQRRGFELARPSGQSLSPFAPQLPGLPPAPAGDDPEPWERQRQEVIERLAAWRDYGAGDLGALVLMAKSGARGNTRLLASLLGPRGSVLDGAGRRVAITHGNDAGLPPAEFFAQVAEVRQALRTLLDGYEREERAAAEQGLAHSFGLLARARRSKRPGVVFALAAAAGEEDPLTDPDSRLFVGLLPQS